MQRPRGEARYAPTRFGAEPSPYPARVIWSRKSYEIAFHNFSAYPLGASRFASSLSFPHFYLPIGESMSNLSPHLINIGVFSLALTLVATATAQDSPSVPVVSTFLADCNTVHALKSCASFNEMITQKDDSILKRLASQVAFVCFRPQEEVFFIISYNPPLFADEKSKTIQRQNGLVTYEIFKDGSADSSHLVFGEWQRDPSGAIYFGKGPKVAGTDSVRVSDSEVSFSFDFENLAHRKTTYSAHIKRSNKRFSETYAWDIPKERKTKAGSTSPRPSDTESGRHNNSGYCAVYE
jgi:hypothetical protein